MTWSERISCFRLFALLGSLSVLVFLAASVVHCPTQGEIFFLRGGDFFRDFYNPMNYLDAENIYTGDGAPMDVVYGCRSERAGPPLGYSVCSTMKFMARMWHPGIGNLYRIMAVLFVTASSSALMLMLYRLIAGSDWRKACFCFLVFTSGLFLFLLERGNGLVMVLPFVLFYFFNYNSPNPLLKELALLSLAFAAGNKITPAVLGVLLLIDKDWKGAGRLILYGLLAIFPPFLFYSGGFANIPIFLENIAVNGHGYLYQDSRVGMYGYGSLFASLFATDSYPLTIHSVIRIFYVVSVIAGLLGLLLAFFEKVRWRRWFLLTMPLLFLSASCNWYNLLYLLPGMIAFFNANERKASSYTLTVLLAVIFSPLQIYIGGTNCSKVLISLAVDIFFGIILFESFMEMIRQKHKYDLKSVTSGTVVTP